MRRRSMIVSLAATMAALGLIAPQVAQSAPATDPRAEREQVRAQAARVASQIDTSKASIAEIDDALQTLADNLDTQEAALEKTEADIRQAERDIENAQQSIARLTAKIAVLRAEMSRRAVQAYVRPDTDELLTVLETKDFTTATNRSFYLELRSQDDADVSDQLQGATVDLGAQRRKATDARKEAVAKRAEQAKRTEAVRQARAEQQRLYDSTEATMQDQIALSVSLSKTDRALSIKIAEQQAQLAARLAAAKAQQQAAPNPPAANRPSVTRPTPTTPTPTTRPTPTTPNTQPPVTAPPTTTPSTPLPPVTGGNSGTVGGIPLCTVGGITVNCAIRTSLTNLLNAARADGVYLSGGGWRNPASQIALRKAHCGTSYYAIYQMPSSSCRPWTARPGTSQHEIGLAIDFNSCSSRSTACYQWLARNAARFGFYNLPSEPWHWSTTGN